MRRVLGFDAWTMGSHHFERMVQPATEKNVDFKLVHLGSWGDEKGRAPSEYIGSLKTRDITFYKTNSISRLLDIEKPDVVLMLSTDSFANRSMIRLCRLRGIPTIHHLHGLQNTNEQIGGQPFKTDVLRRLWTLRGQIVKGLRFAWPCYVMALIETKASPAEWFRFVKDLVDRSFGVRSAKAPADSKATAAVVFIPSEKQVISQIYGYDTDQVFPIGNPDLQKFGFTDDLLDYWKKPKLSQCNTVIYIDGCLLNYGWVYRDASHFKSHLLQTRDFFKKQGFEMIWKPHPAHDKCLIDEIKDELTLCPNEDFLELLKPCKAAITEPSSAGLIPMLLGKPVFLTGYGAWKGQRFGSLFKNYPNAILAQDIEDLSTYRIRNRDVALSIDLEAWIKQNVGPLPSSKLGWRALDVCLNEI